MKRVVRDGPREVLMPDPMPDPMQDPMPTHVQDPGTIPTMAALRAEIDACDRALMALLVRRAALIDRAITLKPAVAMPARVTPRVEQVAGNARANATAAGFDPDFAETLWRQIIEWSIAREEKVLGR